jgi:hypothetical protein
MGYERRYLYTLIDGVTERNWLRTNFADIMGRMLTKINDRQSGSNYDKESVL